MYDVMYNTHPLYNIRTRELSVVIYILNVTESLYILRLKYFEADLYNKNS